MITRAGCRLACQVAMMLGLVACVGARAEETDPRADALSADVWRREHRLIDLHTHIEPLAERYERAIRIFDAVGVGTAIELGSGTLTPGKEGPSDFEKSLAVSKQVCPGRFVHYMLFDYKGWDNPAWSERAVEQVEKAHQLGASGVKEFKRLGLTLKDGRGQLIKIDDPKFDPVWRRCGELGMPVSIHVGDPQAFWEPLDETNERWEELRDHPDWWFGDPKKYPPRMELLGALERVIARHPKTTFVCVHFGNNPEDVAWVDRQLDAHPNMNVDLAARIPEIGRGDREATERLRRLFIKHQDRIFFATDFQVWSRMILGSAGDDERPADHDAVVFYQKCYRFLETGDRDWSHMTPIQGKWTISSINVPPEVQRKVYFDNATRLLARSLPAPTWHAKRIETDFAPDGKLEDEAWSGALPARIEYGLNDAKAYPALSTCVRALWSEKYLYVAYEAPYTQLTMADPPGKAERLGLWDDDVVEVFVGTDSEHPKSYTEYEWAPNGEVLDVKLDLPNKDFPWSSGMESAVVVDREHNIWRVESRIPWSALSATAPRAGVRWRANLFRHDVASRVFVAWNPTLTETTHAPERFGWLEFDP
ncbi:MAG: amidohydrolase family protein [Pirellulales bacterium]|nr:amidohydrolase family protein [Pirellulales bacterium]